MTNEREQPRRDTDPNYDFRMVRAREEGNALVRRATDRYRTTTPREERAVAKRWFPQVFDNAFPKTGGSVVTGLYDDYDDLVERPKPPSFRQRWRAFFARLGRVAP